MTRARRCCWWWFVAALGTGCLFGACTDTPGGPALADADTAADASVADADAADDTGDTGDTGDADGAGDTADGAVDAADAVDAVDAADAVDAVDAADAADAVDTAGPDAPTDLTSDLDAVEPPPAPEPLRILFIGNSFTLGGPIPDVVDALANDAGWPDPHVALSAFGGETLEGHRARAASVAAVDEGDWDVVVLQEYSTRPTDALGDPLQFKTDATWFHDRIKASSPEARVVLYETWARHADHAFYPGSFADPAEMQAQLRFHYTDAADSFIPGAATAAVVPPVEVAPAGDAWELHLAQPDAVRLHASDDYHASRAGQYLSSLVLYATIYDRSVEGLTPWLLSTADAARLQRDADATTGATTPGGPSGMGLAPGLLPGERVVFDLGDTATAAQGWNDLLDPTASQVVNARTDSGARSTVDLVVTTDFGGVNGVGLGANALGYPASASQDSFFCGSFDDHASALLQPAAVTLRDLDPAGRYTLRLFASRAGDDAGRGRLTRYTVGGAWQDVEIGDNTARQAVFGGLAPDAAGELVVEVAVSPEGGARFCYLGVLELERE